ncbi:MAG TPA: glycosyltransferase [bacterium]|nr:glycosyltransferase [bacterium]HOL96445.1 glycosyltransferase [bacterium]HPP02611.1 glycosyltransferase [bacterium]
MLQSGSYQAHPHKIALIGNYLPRRCGIATFTTDLVTALAKENPEGECWAVVMNDVPEGYRYPPQVRFEVNQRLLVDYRLAADFLNMNRVEVVCLQHEFGIFGGEYGAHVLDLLSNLRMPLVTTLHTVLQEPDPGQRAMIKRIAKLSDRLVVMSQRAKQILMEIYGVAAERITMIPHGIPDVPFVDPNFYKDQYGVEGRKVILTFGLLSPGKGIETMIDALPAVIQHHPEAVYIVLGATHPHVKRDQGEAYRLSLQRRARELGVSDHLIFHNRFVDLKELCEFLGAADIYVTPYRNREQITSGTLAYALGSGKAVISTPYWYAEEMLAEGRGRLVPFEDAGALAEQVIDLFTQEVERHAMRKRAYTYCRGMIWKEVARQYLDVFGEVKRERESVPRPVFRARTMGTDIREAPQPKLDHIIRLTDDVGILQHAKYIVPDRDHGYCTDDNARALIAVMMAQEMIADGETITNLACTYLSFLHHAFNEENGRFRNFMGYDRHWLEEVGSEDSHGRAVWGLGEAVALAETNDLRAAAQELFEKAFLALWDFRSPRAWAFALVGIHAFLSRFGGHSEVRRLRERLAGQLMRLYREQASEDWPWIENILTFANGKISQALLLSGRALGDAEMQQAGLRSLEWLMEIQTDPKGHFVPVGNKGWYPRGGEKARFDQQPIEALSMIEACREAYETTRDSKWISQAQRCLEWFLGRNDLKAMLYDHKTGGCCDGLQADGPNRNQGAESTLVCFLSLLHVNQLRGRQLSMDTAEETETQASQEAMIHGR